MLSSRTESILGAIFLACAAFAHFLLGVEWLVRVVGVWCVACGGIWAYMRSVPIGSEGGPPLFYATGSSALILAVMMIGLGAVLLLFPAQTACFVGWHDAKCFI